MLILPKSCFLHIPKTGGSWVKKAIQAANIACEDYTIDGNAHIGLRHCPCPEKFKFTFVRHPVGLYRSYWQFKMTYGWDEANPLDVACRTESFHDFIRNVLDRFPGIYGNSLADFIGEGKNAVDFVGKYENLVEDLILALRYAEESFEENAIRALPPYNVSDKTRFPAQYTPELEDEVRKSETLILTRFNYE